MKIVFLDIDGVFNHNGWYHGRKHIKQDYKEDNTLIHRERSLAEIISEIDESDRHFFQRHCYEIDPTALNVFRTIVEEHDLKIVLSSTWRILTSPKEFKSIMDYHNWYDFPLIGYTPRGGTIRGVEIQYWIDSFNKHHSTIDQYAIIDDDRDFLPHQIAYHFVHTDHRVGFNYRSGQLLESIFSECNTQQPLFEIDYDAEQLYQGRYDLFQM